MKAFAVGAVALAAAVAAPAASACSCIAPSTPRADLARADAAVVGIYLSRYRASATTLLYKFRIVRSVKGRFGSQLTVATGTNSASCGLQVRRGQRVGLLLHRAEGRWTSSLCDQRSPGFFRGVGRTTAGCA